MEVQGKRSGKVVCLCVWGIVACTKVEQRSDFCPSHPTVTGKRLSIHTSSIPLTPSWVFQVLRGCSQRSRHSCCGHGAMWACVGGAVPAPPASSGASAATASPSTGTSTTTRRALAPAPGTGVGWGWVVEAALGEKDGGFGAHGGEMNVVPLRHRCSHRHTAPSPMSG